MNRDILTYPITPAQMKEELAFVAQYFRDLGYAECEALFGFAWGNDYYPGPEWQPVRLSLDALLAEVERVEAADLGQLGFNDLFVSVPPLPLEFRFCNDTDIHLAFDEPSEVTEFFYQRWKACGFSPGEWARDSQGKPSHRLRIN